MSEIKYRLAAGTNMGLVRTNNEDNFVVCPDLTISDWRIPQVSECADLGSYGSLLVVADGMGGANAGEVASAIAVDTIQESFTPDNLQNVIHDDNSVQEFMKDVVKSADLRIFEKSKQDSSTRGMGTTVVMAWILDGKVFVCWCGDSRCYMLNRHKGLVRLSKDHSYVQELIDRGELDPDLAMNHPYSNVITRCLGDMENRAVPDTRIFQLHNGDTILLCSDGLSGLCSDLQILDLLIKHRDDPEECKNQLISAALAEGGHDNVTVALCNIEIPGETEDKEDETLPKGTLPPDAEKPVLSETLPADSKKSKPSTRSKRNAWRWLFFFILFVVIAFFLAKILKHSLHLQEEELLKTDSTEVHAKTDAIVPAPVIVDPAQKEVEVKTEREKNETVPEKDEKTESTESSQPASDSVAAEQSNEESQEPTDTTKQK
jgi:protein phosphatase